METQPRINSLNCDFSETRIVAAMSDNHIQLMNTEMQLISRLNGHLGSVSKAQFLHHGEFIISGCLGGKFILWREENETFVIKMEIKFDIAINSLCGRYKNNFIEVFVGLSDGNLERLTIEEDFTYKREVVFNHRYGILNVDCNDENVISVGDDGRIAFNNKRVINLDNVVDAVISPSSAFDILCIAAITKDKLAVYSLMNDEFEKQEIEIENCNSVAWSRAGFVICVGTDDGFKAYALGKEGVWEQIEVEDE